MIYKLLPIADWTLAQETGRVPASAVDERDGYVHLSERAQAAETAARYFAGQDDIVLLTVDPALLEDLRWEPSRGGELFPHSYSGLPVAAVVRADVLGGDAAAGVAALLA